MKSFLFIINPISGHKKGTIANEIKKLSCELNFSAKIILTQYKGHATLITKQNIQNEFDGIIAVGGDGTINEVASILKNTSTTMGIIPIGSGNGLALHLSIPKKTKKALKQILKGTVQKIDTCSVNNKNFFMLMGVGFDALVASQFEKEKNRGFLKYILIVFSKYFKSTEKEYEFNIDGKQYKQKAWMITFANGSQFGNNIKIAPHASIKDGIIDICIMRKIPLNLLFFTVIKLFKGSLKSNSYVQYLSGKNIQFNSNIKYVNIDGEFWHANSKLNIKIKKKSLLIFSNGNFL